MKTLIIGAGLAGLTAARILQKADVEVRVLEANAQVGGRVRSATHNGFTLDRGFQVLFTGYPAVRRNLNLSKLNLKFIPPGALIRRGHAKDILGDPFRDPTSLMTTLTSDALTLKDKTLVARLSAKLKLKAKADLLLGAETDTRNFLKFYGFSDEAIENFFAPFFGGIFLDRTLATSSHLFKYYYRMLIEGGIAVPAEGMGAIAEQLADGLELSLNTKVVSVEQSDNGVSVKTDGDTFEADTVIIATDPPELARLTGVEPITDAKSSSYLYYASYKQLDSEKRILLNAKSGTLNNAHWLSNVNPAYAPVAKHLLSTTVIGRTEDSDEALDEGVRADLRDWYGDEVDRLELLKVIRIPFAQFAQPPGFAKNLVSNKTEQPNIFVASESTSMSSIQGAMESGEKAAALALARVQGETEVPRYRGT